MTTESPDQEVDPRYIVPGLERGLKILRLFTRRTPELKLSEIAAGLDQTRSATYRLVYTLEKCGYIERDAVSRRFHLTSRVLSIGFEYLQSQPLVELSQPVLREVSDRTQAASHLVVLDDWAAIYVARAAPTAALIANLQIGTRLPAHMTASGRVLLASRSDAEIEVIWKSMQADYSGKGSDATLEEVIRQAHEDKARGHVFGQSHFNAETASLSCPVIGLEGRAQAALNVVGPQVAFDTAGGEAAVRGILHSAAGQISRMLGVDSYGD